MTKKTIPEEFKCFRTGQLINNPVNVVVNNSSVIIDESALLPGEKFSPVKQFEEKLNNWKRENETNIKEPELPSNSSSYTFNYAILGQAGTGISSIIERFTKKSFSNQNKHTQFNFDPVKHKIPCQGSIANLNIYDFGYVNSKWGSAKNAIMRKADAIFLVFDVNNAKSFEMIEEIYAEEAYLISEGCQIIVVGAKIDIENRRVVAAKRAQAFAESKGFSYLETSAKEGTNVDDIFTHPLKPLISKEVNKAITSKREEYNSWVDNYLIARKSITPEQYIGRLDRFFGGCSLNQKEAAVNDIKKALNGDMSILELEEKHAKALGQGKLKEVYKNIKPFLEELNINNTGKTLGS
ncbi:hypothetical protein ACFORL_11655 [Legionella dresdenensis]|uniref:Ras family GTPase n=1 Tax=Legionella dresdenensis TaxID=450200 RepID=A0ABV8CI81_9GAMM